MMINVSAGNYDGLIENLVLVLMQPIKADIASKVKSKLMEVTWKQAVYATERLMLLGRSKLYDNLWGYVCERIQECHTYREKKIEDRKKDESIPEDQQITTKGQLLGQKIVDEILMWCMYARYGKPLFFGGQPVEYKFDSFHGRNPEAIAKEYRQDALDNGVGLKLWKAGGRKNLWCILMDVYISRYEQALNQEESGNDKTLVLSFMQKFYDWLQIERMRQVSEMSITATASTGA